MANDGGVPCLLPLAFLPDGALGLVLSFGSVSDLVAANMVCRSWLIDGNRLDLWKALGDSFEISMPVSLGRPVGGRAVGGVLVGGGKRMLRSSANAKRTLFKSYASTVKADGLKHDATLSEAYTLFRMQDSVPKLRALLRRRWGITFPPASSSSSSSSPCKMKRAAAASAAASATPTTRTLGRTTNATNNSVAATPTSISTSTSTSVSTSTSTSTSASTSTPTSTSISTSTSTSTTTASRGHSSAAMVVVATAKAWRGKGRWTFDVNHRHSIWEGNTLLNFAVRCGRRKSIEFILHRMGADTEIPDYGGFTPLLNTAWRGDACLLKLLIASGARLDVKGVSRGMGPFGPLEWAVRKDRPLTAAFLRSLVEEAGGGGGRGVGEGKEGGLVATAPRNGDSRGSSSTSVDKGTDVVL